MRQAPSRSGGARPASSPLLYLQLSCPVARMAYSCRSRVHLSTGVQVETVQGDCSRSAIFLRSVRLSLTRCLVLLCCVKIRSTHTRSVSQDCSKVTASFGLPPSRSRLWCSVCAKQVIAANQITSCWQLSLTALAVGVAVSWRNSNVAYQL